MITARKLIDFAKFQYLQRIVGIQVGEDPWLDPVAGQWFRERLGSSKGYLEFGSGGSTRLAGRLGIRTISVDCDRFFARTVRKGLATGHQVSLLDAYVGLTGPWSVPYFKKPTSHRLARWRGYITMPFQLIEQKKLEFPDFVMVDGRFRRACALQTALHAKKHCATCDLLIDDYYRDGRDHYAAIESHLGQPERIGFTALFRIDPANDVNMDIVEAALRDYR